MRRKTKQLLATGMALAVLATNLTPVSLAAEMAAEMQTGTVATQAVEVATQAQPDGIATQARHQHSYTQFVSSGFSVMNERTGFALPYVTLACTSTTGTCNQKEKTYYNSLSGVSPDSTTAGTCSSNKVFHYNGGTYRINGQYYTIDEYDYEVPNSKDSSVHNYEVTWTEGEANEYGTGAMYLTVKCKDCGKVFANKQTVTANSNTGTAAECEKNATYTYAANSFRGTVDGKVYSYDQPVTLEVSNSALGHKYTTYVYNEDATCTADGTKTAECDNGCGEKDTVTAEGTKLDHNFENAKPSKWEWSSDYATVTVTLPCQNGNPDCTATTTDVTGDISYKVTKEPTCTAEGEATYTAYYNGYSDVKTKPLPKVKHVYSGEPTWSWNADHTQATATFTCDTCGEAAESTGIYGTIEVKRVEPTCTTEGSITYSTYVIDNGKKYTTEDVVTIPKLAHDAYLDLEWDDDTCTSATATVKCNDCGYERKLDAEDVKITSETTDPTCTKDGHIDYTAEASTTFIAGVEDGIQQEGKAQINGQVKLPATGHYYVPDSDPIWNAADKTVEFHFVCLDEDDEQIVTVPAEKVDSVAPTCTAAGKDVYVADAEYEFVYNGETCKVTASSPYYEIVLPATGHHFGAYTCTANGTEVATCEYCGAADVRPAGAETVCDHHNVDGTDVCPVCGKVNGSALLPQITAASNANTKAITSGAQLVVRAGTLPNGQKVLTVAYLDANGKVLTLNGSWKVRVPVAQLKAALGDAEGTGFEHTLTTADAKQTVGYAVENGNVVFDAAFNGSTAFVLLVD